MPEEWVDEWKEGGRPVLGHTCDRLRAFQAVHEDYGCVPYIDEDAVVWGCDDNNADHPIRFCPFCGVKLPPVKPGEG